MPAWTKLAAAIGILIALVCGAITDYKSRKIPNAIPIAIVCLGVFSGTQWSSKLLDPVILGIILTTAYLISKQRSGGGDIKLYLSITFAYGLIAFAIIIVITLLLRLGMTAIEKAKGKEPSNAFPVCCYFAPAYTVFWMLTAAAVKVLEKGV